ncbi:MAG: MFS transporter [Candidatus Hodarchaeota archaeon]
MLKKGKDEEKTVNLESFKKLSKEERQKIREKKRAETTFPTKMNKYLWFLLIFAGVVTSFDGWCTATVTLAMGSFVRQLDILQQITNPDLFTYFGLSGSPVMMGVILSIAGIGVIMAVSFKYLVDKFGRRPLTLVTAVPFISFSILTAFSPPGPNGIVFFLICKIFANYFLSADIVTIIVAEESPHELRGRLVGFVLATNAIGVSLCAGVQIIGIRIPISGPWGNIMTTWQSMFFLTIIGYIFIVPLFFFLKETKLFNGMKRYEEWRKKKGLKPKTGWFVPLQRKYARPMILSCVVGFLGTLISFAQVTFFALYFAKELNLTAKMVGIVTIPFVAAGGLASFLVGTIIDRWGRIPTIHRFGCTTLIGGALFSWPTVFVCGDISNPFLLTLVVAGGMIGVFSLVMLGATGAIAGLEMLPTHIRSTAMGWSGAISRGAMVLAPFLMMYGAEKLGGLGLSYQFMFALMGMPLTVILFAAYLLAPEGKGRRLEEIVATEIYTKVKVDDKKEYKRPYYFFILAFVAYYISNNIYGWTGGGDPLVIFYMVSFYASLSLIGFLLIVYARKIITE